MNLKNSILPAVFLFLIAKLCFASNLILYPAPPDITPAEDFRVFINGKENFVYSCEPAAYSYFSFAGKVDVEIETTYDVKWVDIRPLSRNIDFSYSSHKIRFTLDKPAQLSIELNGESKRPLYLFANPPKNEKPDLANSDVIYYKGGKIYDGGVIRLKSNQILYVEGGAVLRCAVLCENAENISIKGRGIIDGSIWSYDADKSNYVKQKMMVFKQCSNINIEGVIIVDSPGWTMKFKECNKVSIDNIKHINWNFGSDGVDLVSSSDVIVKNSFLRDNDDNITIKSWGGDLKYPVGKTEGKAVQNIRIENCVIWNMAWGNALEIGFELRCPKISDVIFKNIDIIHVERGAAMSIHNGDYATVENITYDNIRVEDARHKLIDLGIFLSQYSLDRHQDEAERTKRYLHGAWDGVQDADLYGKEKHAKYRGRIRNIIFKDIKVVDGKFPFSLLCGYDKEHNIKDITFENFTVCGKKIKNKTEVKLYTEFTENVVFK